MKTYRYQKVVEEDGTVQLFGLPPHQEVEIVILESSEITKEMIEWLNDIRTRHPFAEMDKEGILNNLRQTRETVCGGESLEG